MLRGSSRSPLLKTCLLALPTDTNNTRRTTALVIAVVLPFTILGGLVLGYLIWRRHSRKTSHGTVTEKPQPTPAVGSTITVPLTNTLPELPIIEAEIVTADRFSTEVVPIRIPSSSRPKARPKRPSARPAVQEEDFGSTSGHIDLPSLAWPTMQDRASYNNPQDQVIELSSAHSDIDFMRGMVPFWERRQVLVHLEASHIHDESEDSPRRLRLYSV